jgi:hypothetical protein
VSLLARHDSTENVNKVKVSVVCVCVCLLTNTFFNIIIV